MTTSSTARPFDEKPVDSGPVIQKALELIHRQRTMVLATSRDDAPWTAPVYFVYNSPGFYFFSSPAARHINQAQEGRPTAASIFCDSDSWEKIQGLQMTGKIQKVGQKAEQIKALGRYLLKFPLAKSFLQPTDSTHAEDASVRHKVRLYVFQPAAIFYMNNRLGFGHRTSIALK